MRTRGKDIPGKSQILVIYDVKFECYFANGPSIWQRGKVVSPIVLGKVRLLQPPVSACSVEIESPPAFGAGEFRLDISLHVCSVATMITRECSGSLTAGSRGRTRPF